MASFLPWDFIPIALIVNIFAVDKVAGLAHIIFSPDFVRICLLDHLALIKYVDIVFCIT